MRPTLGSTAGRLATLVLLALAAAGASGCTGGRAAAGPPPCGRPLSAPPASHAGAAGVATSYLTALATHRYEAAQRLAEACTGQERRSLDRLWMWLGAMPMQAVKIGAAHVTGAARRCQSVRSCTRASARRRRVRG